MAPARGSTRPDGTAIVLAAAAVGALVALFLVLRWSFALVALIGICLGTLAVITLARRKRSESGRLVAGVILGLAMLLIAVQEAALSALASGAFRPPESVCPAVWGPRAIPRLARALRHADADGRVWAADALRSYGHAGLPYWQAAMRDREPRVRVAAAWGLSRYPDPASEPALRAAMQDPDPLVRNAVGTALYATAGSDTFRQAARLLAASGSPDAYVLAAGLASRQYALTEKGAADPDPTVRLGTVMALERITAPRALPLLQAACRDGDSRVRGYAARGLGSVSRHLVREYEQGMRSDGAYDPAWRGGVDQARFDADGTLSQLTSLLEDSSTRVEAEALLALFGLIRDFPPGGPRSSAPFLTRPVSAATYGRLLNALLILSGSQAADPTVSRILHTGFAGRAYVPVFVRRLRDRSLEIRRQSAWMLGCIGDPAVLPDLARADPRNLQSVCADCAGHPCQFCEAIVRIAPGTAVRHPVQIHPLAAVQAAAGPFQHGFVPLRDGTALLTHEP
jgi:HEAT repeat protein